MKSLTLLLIPLLFLSSCTIDWNDEKDKKIVELNQKIEEQKKEKVVNEVSLNFENITYNKIPKDSRLLKCNWKYDSIMVTFEEIWKSHWEISTNSENFELTILDEKMTMFWAEFIILENSDNFLIWMRSYDESGLTELLQLNKNNWIMIDSKTYTKYIWNAPAWFDTIFTCKN